MPIMGLGLPTHGGEIGGVVTAITHGEKGTDTEDVVDMEDADTTVAVGVDMVAVVDVDTVGVVIMEWDEQLDSALDM